ncbi:MAG: hypothetical protein ACKVP7_03050 [Hyphomicrobiaceae bacterium]
MDIVSLLIQLVSGVAGGNVAGSLLKNLSLGSLGNSVAGLVGGSLGGAILNSSLGPSHVAALSNLDPGAIISQIAGGGVGGGVLMAIVGVLRQVFAK